MKKRYFTIVSLILIICASVCAVFGMRTSGKAFADFTTNTTQYFDMEGVVDFAFGKKIANNRYIYLAYANSFCKYDLASQTASNYISENNITNIYAFDSPTANEQDLIVITTTDNAYLYDANQNKYTFDAIMDHSSIDVAFVEGKFVIAYVAGSTLIVNVYSSENLTTLESSSDIVLSGSEYFVQIYGEHALLLNKANDSNQIVDFNYINSSTNYITHSNINFYTHNNFLVTDTCYVVVTGELIVTIDKTTFARVDFNLTHATDDAAYISGNIDTATSMKYRENKVFIYDATNKCIQSFDLSNNTLTNPQVELGSFGRDIDRFYKVNSILVRYNGFSGDEYIVSDYGNSRIMLVAEENEVLGVPAERANDLTLDEYNNLWYFVNNTTNSTIYKYSISTSTITHYDYDGQIISICLDNQTNLYILDNTNNIYKTSSSEFNPELYLNLSDKYITTNLDSRIYYSTKSNGIYVSTGNTIYQVAQVVKSYSYDSQILDYVIDFEENIIAIVSSGKVAKYNFASESTASLNGYANCTCIGINQLNGTILLYDKNNSKFVSLKDDTISKGMGDFEHYVPNAKDAVANSYIYNYASISGLIYDYPNYIGNAYNANGEVTKVILLSEERSTTGFEYVMFEIGNKKYFGYAKSSDLTEYGTTPFPEHSSNLVVIENNTPILKYPSIGLVSSRIGANEITLNNQIVIGKYQRSNVINTYTTYPVSLNGRNYYVVTVDGGYGYVYAGDVTEYENSYNQNVKVDNAYVTTHDHTDYVPLYDTDNGENEVGKLERGKRVYVMEYDKSKDYTLVKYLDEAGKEKMGYVPTKYIHMDANKAMLISAIVTLFLGLVAAVVLTVEYIKYKKK